MESHPGGGSPVDLRSTLRRAGAPLAFTIVVAAVPVAVVAVVARPAGLVALKLAAAEIPRAAGAAAPTGDAVAGDVPDLAPRAVAVCGRATGAAGVALAIDG